MMNEHGQSDDKIIPKKSLNKGRQKLLAEVMEGSESTEGNGMQQNMCQTQGWASVQSKLQLVHQRAKEDKKTKFTALMHHIYDVDTLAHAYSQIKRGAAAGVDGETWRSYGEELRSNLEDLSERLKRGAYRAKPVRRVYIPKPDGQQRPLGVTVLEDKIVQRATVEVLNAVYEADFVGFSYGFRPGRSQHKALDALYAGIMTKKVSWVLDADIRDYFSSISHEWLVKFVEHRIADKRVVRLIKKWMNAGVLENGKVTYNESGTQQGGSASPQLANVYLHYVFDLWVQQWRKKQAGGEVIAVRYGDDTIVGFQYQLDAQRFLQELKERFQKFGLELHPDKTRLIEFGRFAAERRKKRGEGKPETFTFLGFTHICGQTREGKFKVERRTIKKRMHAKVKAIKAELRKCMHTSIQEVGNWLKSILIGHYQYYGVPDNYRAMNDFRHLVYWHWRRQLMQRSQKGHMTWERMSRIIDRWLPRPHIYHQYPLERMGVIIRGKSLVR